MITLASALVHVPAQPVHPVPLPATRSLVVLLEATPHDLAPGERVDVLVTRQGRSRTVLASAPVVAVEPLGVTLEVAWAEASPFLQALDHGEVSLAASPPRRLSFADHFLLSGPRDSL